MQPSVCGGWRDRYLTSDPSQREHMHETEVERGGIHPEIVKKEWKSRSLSKAALFSLRCAD